MTDSIDKSPLGHTTVYSSKYDSSLLFPIVRAPSREQLPNSKAISFFGKDLWTAYEVSWLNLRGKPQVALCEFEFDCHSTHIIESKSFKLYLNSFNQSEFKSREQVAETMQRDLSLAAGANVQVKFYSVSDAKLELDSASDAILLDELDLEVSHYHPDASLLQIHTGATVKESLVSHLLKTNCPVTGQPDWASVQVEYQGPVIDRESLLKYIISFREHQDFHEHCIERIFFDILEQCQPQTLSVYGRYTRRGGLDINPFRSTSKNDLPNLGRLVRQ